MAWPVSWSFESMTGKRRRAPSLRPIQFTWAFLVFSDQSIRSRFASSRSAYCVILKNHCAIRRCPLRRCHARGPGEEMEVVVPQDDDEPVLLLDCPAQHRER